MAVRVFLAGVEREVLATGLSIAATVNGYDTAVADVLSPTATYRPALDDELIVIEDTGGTSATSLAIGTGSKTLTVQAGLSLVIGERVRLYSQGAVTQWMEGRITDYTGTTLIVDVTATNGSGTYADWVIARRIFGGVVLRTEERGLGDQPVAAIVTRVEAADFNQYVERRVLNVTIPAGSLLAALQLLVTYLAPWGVVLAPDQVTGPSLPAIELPFTTLRNALDTLSTLSGGYVWEVDYYKLLRMYLPSTRPAPFNVTTAGQESRGDLRVDRNRDGYVNRVLVLYDHGTKLKEAPAVPPTLPWEIILRADDTTDDAAAQALADHYLTSHNTAPAVVRYRTWREGLLCGETQTISVGARNVNNTFIVTEVRAAPWGPGRLAREVTAVENSETYDKNWRRVYEQWSAGGGTTAVPGGGAGGGGGVAGKTAYFLGGGGTEAVQSATPTWVAASPVRVQVTAPASGAATVVARLRAAAGSVTARLQNVSDGTTAGTSAVVTPPDWATWELVTFGVTLTPGTKIYELQLLPSLANTDVAGTGHLIV